MLDDRFPKSCPKIENQPKSPIRNHIIPLPLLSRLQITRLQLLYFQCAPTTIRIPYQHTSTTTTNKLVISLTNLPTTGQQKHQSSLQGCRQTFGLIQATHSSLPDQPTFNPVRHYTNTIWTYRSLCNFKLLLLTDHQTTCPLDHHPRIQAAPPPIWALQSSRTKAAHDAKQHTALSSRTLLIPTTALDVQR
jgi:hypothetical protein